jgi:signal-transduction protein with cAMP-binding, CBS, and nucleotidyltransferase domain
MAGSLQEATVAALRLHPPFDGMGSKSLQFLAGRLQLAYYARGTAIVSPQDGPVRHLHILKQGRVRGGAAGALPGASDVVLGAGMPDRRADQPCAAAYTYAAEEVVSAGTPSADFDKRPVAHASASSARAPCPRCWSNRTAHRARRRARRRGR